ncbi:hypothetical protein GQ43DRAFT_468535 [Delitschia confertaspora ATCC 74209]|uniref:Uncharacterized protein n=1 Tax=Delitschia confertaspora ATCC 74209 TaxID=1513339 RepID=A0A9P4JTX2_9PLEO|nr:hypothetical protein GQ43DRAFT_468535 [Delitschia confertaspora ATCC 74209]
MTVSNTVLRLQPAPSNSLDDAAWKKEIDDEVAKLLSALDEDELARVTSALRHGKHCVFWPDRRLGTPAARAVRTIMDGWIWKTGRNGLFKSPKGFQYHSSGSH